jgi:hypothetical protein
MLMPPSIQSVLSFAKIFSFADLILYPYLFPLETALQWKYSSILLLTTSITLPLASSF